MSDEKTSVERGPEPASPTPWRLVGRAGCGEYIEDADGESLCDGDDSAIVHRVSSWDTLCDERDALKAENTDLNRRLVTMRAELEQVKQERDGMYVHVLPEMGRGPLRSKYVDGKNFFLDGEASGDD